MRLPELRTNLKKNNVIQMAMRGINYSASAQDGELAESQNISVRQYPYLTTRRRRDRQESYTGVTALSAWEKLIAVSGTDLLYDGTVVGSVTEGEKQFAVVNNKLVIFPDKVYLDLTDMQVKPIDVELDVHKATFTTDTISGYMGIANSFPLVARTQGDDSLGDIIVVGKEKIGDTQTHIKYWETGTLGGCVYLTNSGGTTRWDELLRPGDEIVFYFPDALDQTSLKLMAYNATVRGFISHAYIYLESPLPAGNIDAEVNVEIWRAADKSLSYLSGRQSVYTLASDGTSFDHTSDILAPTQGNPSVGRSFVRVQHESLSGAKKADAIVGTPYDVSDILKDIDTITISGCETLTDNNKVINITALTANSIKTTANAFEAGDEFSIKASRVTPDLDFICSHENRLWGCNSEEQTIYISALGDPLNFITFEGVATDSFAVAVGTPGDFTGCTSLGSSVLFWKTNSLHKVLGSYPAEYALYTYEVEGVKAGCHKSQQVINDTLYYLGEHGVFAYNGGYPTLISPQFGEKVFSQGVAGNDGDSYYLSAMEGTTPHLLVYETRYGLWINEDNLRAVDFARIGKTLYCADDSGRVFIMDDGNEDLDIEWIAQFAPVYETIEGRKAYSKLNLRVHLPEGSYLVADVRIDGQVWQEAGRIVGSDADVSTMWIKFNRCDKFELKLYGHGPCTILGIMREFMVGSDM